MSGPRVLAIMGSGEVAPTMAKVHRALFESLGDRSPPAALLDTSYGFQENADELSARIVEFFATSVGRPIGVASYRSREVDAVARATALARIHEARYVMAGPGSPSYALRQWLGGPIPAALAAKLTGGGILTMASAAALTVGIVTIPVYEIYKAGEDPRWLEGLDLIGAALGLRAAIVPHYDNAEGGTHDTRFCYMGERRLRILERALPDGAFILGVDSHTALVLDLEHRTASVTGLGGVTIRVDGRSTVLPSGTDVPVDTIDSLAHDLAEGGRGRVSSAGESRQVAYTRGVGSSRASLPDGMARLEGAFLEALRQREARTAVGALLDIDSTIAARVRAGEDSPDLDSAAATFHALIVRLGEQAAIGSRDPRAALEPFVSLLLELRASARERHDWATADLVRDRLAAAGVDVRDEPGGSTWFLTSSSQD
jgi:hypothetical protein